MFDESLVDVVRSSGAMMLLTSSNTVLFIKT